MEGPSEGTKLFYLMNVMLIFVSNQIFKTAQTAKFCHLLLLLLLRRRRRRRRRGCCGSCGCCCCCCCRRPNTFSLRSVACCRGFKSEQNLEVLRCCQSGIREESSGIIWWHSMTPMNLPNLYGTPTKESTTV